MGTAAIQWTDEVVAAACAAERQSGVDAAALLAIAHVETAGVAHAVFSGRREPLIRFEGHYFDRLLAPDARARARRQGLADPKAGRIKNPAAQSARWRLLDRAAAIDEAAAYASVSWGLGQVMGAHWKGLGFADPQAIAAEARRSAEGQLGIVAAFLRHEGLDALLAKGAFAAFARRYNGPAFARNRYDTKIAAAYRAAKIRLAQEPDGRPAFAQGARGAAVAVLQRDLVRHGFVLSVDGIFGPRTAQALRAFEAGKSRQIMGPIMELPRGVGEAQERAVDVPTPSTVSEGWLRLPAMLRTVPSWLAFRPSILRSTRSSSISTERSSVSPTTQQPSPSRPPQGTG